MWSINVIMMSYLQKWRHIFSFASCSCCDCSRDLKLDSINKCDICNLRIELWCHRVWCYNLWTKALSKLWKITT